MQRFGKVMLFHAPCPAFEIRNRARHTKHAVVSARGSTEFLHRTFEPFALGLRQRAVAFQVHHAQFGIRLAGAKQCLLACLDDALTNGGAVVVMKAVDELRRNSSKWRGKESGSYSLNM